MEKSKGGRPKSPNKLTEKELSEKRKKNRELLGKPSSGSITFQMLKAVIDVVKNEEDIEKIIENSSKRLAELGFNEDECRKLVRNRFLKK